MAEVPSLREFEQATAAGDKVAAWESAVRIMGWLSDHHLLEAVLSTGPYEIHGMKISDRAGKSFAGHYASGRGYAILRKQFDKLLVDQARRSGVTITEGLKAEKLILENGRVCGVSAINPETEILHSIGSKAALSILPAALINPGDGVLMTIPGEPALKTVVWRVAGSKRMIMPGSGPTGMSVK